MKQLCDTTNKLAGKYSKPERIIENKTGKLITGIQEQRNIWIEHFEELLNRSTFLDIEAPYTDLPIDVT
ncbi:unnamed protein product [Schistosoma margrebowiei]|uniref:Uncharacterized protein n=1 Tax=Schistosoma margrebowiei TaxID=48269 RepID=A0A183NAH2_9TREM|nr:unnamed protein product [Schistosoma margrebowiei]